MRHAPFYVDNWLWDTTRAGASAYTLNPEMEADKIRRMSMYQQAGIMPSLPL